MKETLLKVGSAVTIIIGIYLLVLGVVFLVAPSAFPSFAVWVAANPAVADPLTLTYRWVGVLFIALAIPLLAIGATAYRKGEKWSWYTLLAMGIVGWFGSLAIHTRYPAPSTVYFSIIGTILFLIAIILPAKTILSK